MVQGGIEMKSRTLCRFILSLVLLVVFPAIAEAGDECGKQSLRKTATNDHYNFFDVNTTLTWIGNNGDGSFDPNTRIGGFYWPKGTTKTAVYEDGPVWGGLIGGRITLGGSQYSHGLQAGPIVGSGINARPDNPNDPRHRVYKIQKSWRELKATEPALYAAMRRDYIEWPGDLGAPFIDKNADGRWNPPQLDADDWQTGGDEPRFVGDQQLWFVANDMNSSVTRRLYGSDSIGLEIQCLVWGFAQDGIPGNTVFKKYTIINKGVNRLDSMYLGYWSDFDLGSANDDFVGCDTTLGLAYGYNGLPHDAVYGDAPPAVGYVLLQGPLVSTGSPLDSGLFGFKYRVGVRNLPMTAFMFFLCGDATYSCPAGSQGAVPMYRSMQGLTPSNGSLPLDPTTNQPTRFPLAGDPVSGRGWIDGIYRGPGDRYHLQSSGPLTFAPGDTQEVTMAIVIAQGTDRLSSVALLKDYTAGVRSFFNNWIRGGGVIYPSSAVNTRFSGSTANIDVRVTVPPSTMTSINAELAVLDGSVVVSGPLYDDGAHGEGAANDGVFGNTLAAAARRDGLQLNITMTDTHGATSRWNGMVTDIPTAAMEIIDVRVVSDNLNNDGIANPGENVRYSFTLRNSSAFDLGGLTITAFPEYTANVIDVDTLPAGTAHPMVYDAGQPESYLSFQLPDTYSAQEYRTVVAITDKHHNKWVDTLAFPAAPLSRNFAMVEHHGDSAVGFPIIRIVAPGSIRNHTYVIRGIDSVDASRMPGFMLNDSTDGRVLISSHALPDDLGHTVPPTDGFKVFKGTLDNRIHGESWSFEPWMNKWFTGRYSGGDLVDGAVSVAANVTGSTVLRNAWHAVEVRFGVRKSYTDTDGNGKCDPGEPYVVDSVNIQTAQRAFFYSGYGANRYLGCYWVPFTAWDVDQVPGRQLAVVVRDANANRQWDVQGYSGPDSLLESVWVLEHPYSDGTAFDPAGGGKDAMADSMRGSPGLWVMDLIRSFATWRDLYSAAGVLKLVPSRLITSRDLFIFNPTILMDTSNAAGIPEETALAQNYPNPFNSQTTISFTVPRRSKVALRIYNILGQLVRTLTDEVREPGVSVLPWDGRDHKGVQVASGVYFYRLETEGAILARKLVLVK